MFQSVKALFAVVVALSTQYTNLHCLAQSAASPLTPSSKAVVRIAQGVLQKHSNGSEPMTANERVLKLFEQLALKAFRKQVGKPATPSHDKINWRDPSYINTLTLLNVTVTLLAAPSMDCKRIVGGSTSQGGPFEFGCLVSGYITKTSGIWISINPDLLLPPNPQMATSSGRFDVITHLNNATGIPLYFSPVGIYDGKPLPAMANSFWFRTAVDNMRASTQGTITQSGLASDVHFEKLSDQAPVARAIGDRVLNKAAADGFCDIFSGMIKAPALKQMLATERRNLMFSPSGSY